MKSNPKLVLNDSRRSFTKSMALALTAAPFAAKLTEASPVQQTKTQRDQAGLFLKTHDTPPPLVFENGSFVVERVGEFLRDDESPNSTTTRKEYYIRPVSGTTTVVPAHIKIVDGSGEILYRNDKADDCVISCVLQAASGTQTVNARTAADKSKFVIDLDSGKSLDIGDHGHNDKPTSKKRDRRYRHAGTVNIKEIKIMRGTAVLYNAATADLPANGDDVKIMIWLEP